MIYITPAHKHSFAVIAPDLLASFGFDLFGSYEEAVKFADELAAEEEVDIVDLVTQAERS